MLCVIVICGRSGLSAVVTPAAPRGGVGGRRPQLPRGVVVAVVVGARGEYPLSLVMSRVALVEWQRALSRQFAANVPLRSHPLCLGGLALC